LDTYEKAFVKEKTFIQPDRSQTEWIWRREAVVGSHGTRRVLKMVPRNVHFTVSRR
jgi:hypothetical protein